MFKAPKLKIAFSVFVLKYVFQSANDLSKKIGAVSVYFLALLFKYLLKISEGSPKKYSRLFDPFLWLRRCLKEAPIRPKIMTDYLLFL